MKSIIAFILLCVGAIAQPAIPFPTMRTAPSTCSVGQYFLDTSATTPTLRQCNGANTWVAVGFSVAAPPGGPGGSCSTTDSYLSAGSIYTCQSGVWTAAGSGGGGASSGIPQVNILLNGVSSTPQTTTTTNTVFPVGTSGPVINCTSFTTAGQGVEIVGAGAAGALYVGTIVSCVGATLKVNPTTSTSVTSAAVRHDETVALQAILTAASAAPTLMIVPNVGACYNISSQLTLNSGGQASAAVFAMRGDLAGTGATGSCLSAKAAMTSELELLSWHGGYIEHISFDMGNLATYGLWINSVNNTSAVDATYQDYLNDVTFVNMGNSTSGIRYADSTSCSPTPQVSEQSVRSAKFYGDASTAVNAVKIDCGGNVKNFTFEDTVMSGFTTPMSITHQASSAITMIRPEFLSSTTVDISMPDGGTLNIQGGESESSLKFLNIGCGGCTVPTEFNISGFVWEGVTDTGDTVITEAGNPTTGFITASHFKNSRTGATLPKITVSGGLVSIANDYTNAASATPPWGLTSSPGVFSLGDKNGTTAINGAVQVAGSSGGLTFGASSASLVVSDQGSGSNNYLIGGVSLSNLDFDSGQTTVRNAAGSANFGNWNSTGYTNTGGMIGASATKPTVTGCGTISSPLGGALSGTFVTSGTSCTPVLTVLPATTTGYACLVWDVTHPLASGVPYGNTAYTTTSATFPTFSTTASDVIAFTCPVSF